MATTKRKNSTAARSTSETKVVRAHRPINTRQRAAALAVGAAFMQSMWVQPSWAAQPAEPTANLPTGGKWVNNPDGTAGGTIKTPSATEMQMYQNQRAGVVDFNCFCSRQGTLINLTAPTTDSTTLIRSTEGANLWGRFTANDKVFITSSAGVYFSRTASVDVNSLLATSLSIANADFFAGRYNFSKDGSAGSVVNDGHINIVSVGGYAVLAGPQVQNNGVIVARAGTVALAAGDRVTLDMVGDGLIKVSVDAAALNALALNAGSIDADGGHVVLTARSANALLDTVINNTGVIRARSLVQRGGEIVLDGGGAGIVANSGTLDVSGTDAGAKGGNVAVLGQYVALANGTRIDASGDAGGGNVNIGGSYQGQGPLPNASKTFVASDATINADAINNGDGGNVIVWADNSTKFYGSISARGGANGGDGGFVEVSGKQYLTFAGSVDTRAANGRTGTLLLDPDNLDIVDAGGDQDGQLTTGTDGVINFNDANTAANSLSVAEINTVGATNNIVLHAGGLTFSNTQDIALGNNQDFTILVDNSQTGATGGTNNISNLLGNAFSISTLGNGNINIQTVGGSIDLSNVTLSGVNGVVVSTGTTGGAVTVGAITVTSGAIALTSGTNLTLTGAVSASGAFTADFAQASAGTFSTNNTIAGSSKTISSGTAGSTFDFSAATGTVTATLAGSGATDTLKGRNVANTWTINAANGGNVVGSGTLTYTGIGTLVGGTNTDAFTLSGAGSAVSIDGGANTDTLTRTTKTWNLTGSGTGNVGTTTWTSIENLTDTGAGTFNMASGANGSITGSLTSGNGSTIDFSGYTGGVSFNLSGTAGKTTGVGGTVTLGTTTTVVDSGGADTISGTAKVYNLTGADSGTSGTTSWTGFENLADTGAGTFNMHSGANGSITGSLTSGNASKIDYTGYTGGVAFDLNGTTTKTTGVGQTVTLGTATVTGVAATSDTITGTGQTYTVTGSNAGNNGTISWTSFENLSDATTGTLQATGATWTLNASNTGSVSNLSGTFSGMGNLTNTGAGTFNMHGAGNGSITGNLTSGAASKIDYTGYTGGVAFDLNGTLNKTTGVGGTLTLGTTTVTGVAATSDTITGAAQTYNMTGANAGNNGTISWTSFENLTDSGAGTFSLTATGSLTGDITAVGGALSYAAFGSAVQLNLSTGVYTGFGTVNGIASVIGSGLSDTVLGATQTWNLTGANAGNNGAISWSSFENLTDSGAGTFNMAVGANGSIGGNLTTGAGSKIDFSTYTGGVAFNLNGTANKTTGVTGTVSSANITTVVDSGGADTISGTAKVYNLTGANSGNSGTTSWTAFENLADTGAGTFNMASGANGSITGSLTSGNGSTIDFSGYTGGVSFNLSGTAGKTTGVGGTVTLGTTTTVVDSGGADTISGTAKVYNLTGADSGTSGTTSWTGFENLADTGAGTFNMHSGANGSITGSLTSGNASKIDYTGYTGGVAFDLNGTTTKTTGVGQTVTLGTATVTGVAATSDTITGTGQTYTVTGSNAGNNGTISWTSFENLSDATTGTLQATGATWTLNASNTGSVSNLSGTFSGMGNLTNTGAGTFNMHGAGNGSITGNLTSGAASKIDYTGYTGGVAFDLNGTLNKTTGVGGTLTLGTTTVTGVAATSDTITGAAQTYNMTGANAGNNGTISWTSFENLTDSGAGTFSLTATGSLTGDITAVGGALSYAAFGSAVQLNLSTGVYTGFGTVNGIASVIGSGLSDTVLGATQTWNLTGANAGNNGAISWSSFENLTDSGAGTFNMAVGANGSIGGNLTTGAGSKIDFSTYTGGVAFNLNGTANKTTGVTGTVSSANITTVVDSGGADTISGTAKVYNLTGANSGNSGTTSWTAFENLADTGAGTFNVNTLGSISGALNGGGSGQLSYVAHGGPVTLNLNGGAFTGIAGAVTGISNVTGSLSGADSVTGTSKTYTLTGLDAGNNGSTFTWSGFENIADTATGTISAANQVTTLTGANSGTTNYLSGTFTKIGNLTDTGAGTFNVNTLGSISGALNGGGSGQLSYVAHGGPVTLNLNGGAFTGIAGAVTGISNVTGSLSGADSVTGTSKTYTLTGLDAGNNGSTFTWSGFENIADTATGTISAANQVTTLTGANSGTTNYLSGTFTKIGNLTDTGAGTFNVNTLGSISGALNGGGSGQLSYVAHGGPVTLNLNGGAFTGIAGAVTGISNVTGSLSGADSVTGTSKTYTLTGLDAGNNGSTFTWSGFENIADTATGTISAANQVTTLTGANSGTTNYLSGTFTKIGNLTDTGAGTFNVSTPGSISGALNGGPGGGRLSYASQAGPVTLSLNGGGFTGIGGAVTNISTVVGTASAGDSVTGTNKIYNLFGADAGSSGALSWSSFENLVDSGAGTFNVNGGSITGNLSSGANGLVSYAGNPFAVVVRLDTSPGGFAGIAGTVTGINKLTGSGGSDVLLGNNRTWNLTGPNAGNTAGYTWTSFENVVDQGTTTTFNGSPGSSLDGVLGTGTATAITLNGTLTTGGQQLYAGAVTLGSATTIVGGAQVGFGSVTGTTFNFSATAAFDITAGAIDTGTGTITLIAGGALNVSSVRTTAITPAPGNPVGTFSAGSNVLAMFMDIEDQASTGSPRQVLLTGSASSWTLTGPAGFPPDFAPTAASVGITFNGAILAGIGLAAQAITGSIIGGVVADAARQAVLESQQTDSVQQQVAYGFAGDVGTTPPMDHRIDETGISVPRCFNDSREGQSCQ